MLGVGVAGNPATAIHPYHHATVEKRSVALTPIIVAELRAAVEGGDYGSVSEVVRDALRDWRLRRKIETLEIEGPSEHYAWPAPP